MSDMLTLAIEEDDNFTIAAVLSRRFSSTPKEKNNKTVFQDS